MPNHYGLQSNLQLSPEASGRVLHELTLTAHDKALFNRHAAKRLDQMVTEGQVKQHLGLQSGMFGQAPTLPQAIMRTQFNGIAGIPQQMGQIPVGQRKKPNINMNMNAAEKRLDNMYSK